MTSSSSSSSSSPSPAFDGCRSDTTIDYYFPEEIIELVLSKCPVKSVVRFKSVSKSWQSIVSDARFTKAHRIRRSQLPENQDKYILLVCPEEEKQVLRLVAGAHIYVVISDSSKKIFNIESVLQYPSSLLNLDLEPLSSCNGLILLTQQGYYRRIQQQNYILWNPSIRKHTIITRPQSVGLRLKWQREPHIHPLLDPLSRPHPHLYYDSVTDDHKIVFYNERLHVVYSCHKRNWSGIKDFPNYAHDGGFLDGCFYSIKNGEIVCFDTRDENLHKFRLPDEMEEEPDLYVSDLLGCLYLFGRLKDDTRSCCTWIMEKDGSFEKEEEEEADEEDSYLFWKLFNMEKEEVADVTMMGKPCVVKFHGDESRMRHHYRRLAYSETLYMP